MSRKRIQFQISRSSSYGVGLDRLAADSRVGVRKMAEDAERTATHEIHVKKLSEYYVQFKRQVLSYQGCTLGLFPAIGDPEKESKVAYVRDSIYCAAASWALSQAYRRIDDDQGKTHELGQSAVKCMRGILFCWLQQADKVEKFKQNQSSSHALHTKFDLVTGDPISKDGDFENLQIDVIALYLIFLVEMISSGLKIIFTTDEVNFVQNLVFYVERAYRTPDYGMWERGTKYNNGSSELHASSIGMAKAALEAVNGFNLYGEQGASWSVIYVDIDAHNRNRTIFETILPRESNSKNTDASLLPSVTWPAFAMHERHLHDRTIDKVKRRLQGKYGIKRFLRDGYKTVVEDKNRKYYKPAEIKMFDGIECEWPMFYVYLIIDCFFKGDLDGADNYNEILQKLLVSTNEGKVIPRYYYLPEDSLDDEQENPGSCIKYCSDEGADGSIFLWGQSIYIISQLLVDDLLNIAELDPIRRSLPASERPKVNVRYSSFQGTPCDLVVQVVLIAESARLQQVLNTYGIETQTPHQIEPIQIWAPKELTKAYELLGLNNKLSLTGRPSRPFGVLSTSKIYRAMGSTVLCYPLLFEWHDFYLAQDLSLIIDDLKNDLAFVGKCWKLSGRPTFCMVLRENNIRGPYFGEFLELLSQLKRGDIDGVNVRVARLQTLLSSACVEHLDFLHTLTDGSIFQPFEEKSVTTPFASMTAMPQIMELRYEEGINYQDVTQRSNWDVYQMMCQTDNLKAKSQYLHVLLMRDGPNHCIEDKTIRERIEVLIQKAGTHKHWWVVRFCSALLGKLVDSLAPSITSILVRGKQVTLGVFGHEEEVVDKPLAPNEIKSIIYAKCTPYDICQAVLQQELIISIGKFIASAPDLFDGILKIRIGWFVHAMQVELFQGDEKDRDIHSLSPNIVKQLVYSVLTRNITDSEFRSPLQKRQLDGALNRVPKDFYERVWQILERTPGGIKVAGYLLPQQPTMSDMTMYELNFSLLVEQMLSKIIDPAYRQIVVEAFMVVSTILDRNPELEFKKTVDMDGLINEGFLDFRQSLSQVEGKEVEKGQMDSTDKRDDMKRFLNTPPNVTHGTTGFIAKSVVKALLDGEVKMASEDLCAIS